MKFGTKLKLSIRKAGLTQKEVAAKMDVLQSTFSNWCNERNGLSNKDLFKLASIIGTTTDFLLDETRTDFPTREGLAEEKAVMVIFRKSHLTLGDFATVMSTYIEQAKRSGRILEDNLETADPSGPDHSPSRGKAV